MGKVIATILNRFGRRGQLKKAATRKSRGGNGG